MASAVRAGFSTASRSYDVPMKGATGTPMTTIRIKPKPKPEVADRLCPECWSVAGEPCRRVIGRGKRGSIKRGGLLTKIHSARRNRTGHGDPGPLPKKQAKPKRT